MASWGDSQKKTYDKAYGVYFISPLKTDKEVKIGFSRNINSRVQGYRTCYKGDCVVWAVAIYDPSPEDTEFSSLGETAIHKWLSSKKGGGAMGVKRLKSRSGNKTNTEWFEFPDTVAMYKTLEQMTKQMPLPNWINVYFDPISGKSVRGHRMWTKTKDQDMPHEEGEEYEDKKRGILKRGIQRKTNNRLRLSRVEQNRLHIEAQERAREKEERRVAQLKAKGQSVAAKRPQPDLASRPSTIERAQSLTKDAMSIQNLVLPTAPEVTIGGIPMSLIPMP